MVELKSRIMTIDEVNRINEGAGVILNDEVDLANLNWYDISHGKLSERALVEFREYIDWDVLFDNSKTCTENLSLDTCEILAKCFDSSWDLSSLIISCKNTDEAFVRKYINKLDDDDLTSIVVLRSRQVVSEEFITEFADRLDWWDTCRERVLSEDLIRTHKDTHIQWTALSACANLTEEFIEEMAEYIEWDDLIHRDNKLSKEFIVRNINRFKMIKGLHAYYSDIPKVKEIYDNLVAEEARIEAERVADVERRMSGLTRDELFSKFSRIELDIALKGYDNERLVRLDDRCRIVCCSDDYMKIHRVSTDEPFELFLFRLYKIREHFEFFNPPKNNPDLDGQTQMEGFLKDIEKYNH